MPTLKKIAATLAASLLPVTALAATIGGVDYATQYDYREFFNAADGRAFRVVLVGTPFPGAPVESTAGPLLAQMQTAKPQPRLTFTYDVPSERPRPDYRLVLVFDAAGDFDRSGVGPLAQSDQGVVFWADDARQIPTIVGRIPEVLDGRHAATDVRIRLESPVAGAFNPGNLVSGTLQVTVCPWDCNVLVSLPFALRVP